MKLGRRRAATGIAVIGLTIVGLGDDDAALIPLWKEKRGETALLICQAMLSSSSGYA